MREPSCRALFARRPRSRPPPSSRAQRHRRRCRATSRSWCRSPRASNDVIARAIAVPLGARLGIPVVVENKAGAAGVIGSDSVAKSPRDGSVLLLTFVELPHRRGHAEGAALRSAHGVRSGRDGGARSDDPRGLRNDALRDTGRRRERGTRETGLLNYGTAGIGWIAHLTTELLDDTAKVSMMYAFPTRARPMRRPTRRRSDPGDDQQLQHRRAAHEGRKDPRGRCHVREATPCVPRHAAPRDRRARLRRRHLGRCLRAGRHARRDRRAP